MPTLLSLARLWLLLKLAAAFCHRHLIWVWFQTFLKLIHSMHLAVGAQPCLAAAGIAAEACTASQPMVWGIGPAWCR